MNIPRSEHPRPQLKRENWENLNEKWQFELDNGRSGEARKLYEADKVLKNEIIVPFCPQSKLSGVEYTDFILGCCYKRKFDLTEEKLNGRVILHFGAVDYSCKVYINSVCVGTHTGGYTPFEFDITENAKVGANTVTLFVTDDEQGKDVPLGKQSKEFYSRGCCYTRTTGIWQTVWLEFVPKNYVKSIRYTPDIYSGAVTVALELAGEGEVSVKTQFNGSNTGEASVFGRGRVTLTIPLKEKHLWQVGEGNLYDVEITFGNDSVKSYFGLREVALDGKDFLINGKKVFQRLVLDQGFYPDGIYTAPSDSELENDIRRSLDCGFNGARLHQKVFEERFLYYCDKYGYIVWGEYASWGLDHTEKESIFNFLPQWLEAVKRDINHPSIVLWCPFNETWKINDRRQKDEILDLVYTSTKLADPTRPCIDTSGYVHASQTDVYDVHDYSQDYKVLKEHLSDLYKCKVSIMPGGDGKEYSGQPFAVSEYGGIAWNLKENGWGYGNGPKTLDEFYTRLEDLTDAVLSNGNIFSFCYTQLTDVEQEQNGLYTYDRKPKFHSEKLKKIFGKEAEYEK